MKCTLCGYEYIFHDWESELSIQTQGKRTQIKVADHWKRDHSDIVLLLTWLLREFTYRPLEETTN